MSRASGADAARAAAEAAAEAEALRARAQVPPDLRSLLADAPALERHFAWSDPPTARRPGEPDAALASALLKIADGLALEELDPRERYAILASPSTLSGLVPQAAGRRPGRAEGRAMMKDV